MKKIDLDFIKGNKNLFSHKKCVFVVGAGISVASGIPDFRSPSGIFASLKKQLKIGGMELFTYNFGIKAETRKTYLNYISSLKQLCVSSKPNPTHEFLANFPKSRIYTQNIDGLEEEAGVLFDKTKNSKGVYLHGNLQYLVCQYCGFKKEFTAEESIKFSNGEEIECINCLKRREHCLRNGIRKKPVGLLHPGIVHYQQIHPDGAFIGRMVESDKDLDLLVVIGTSLVVEGVKKIVRMFSRCEGVSGRRILVNLTPPKSEWKGCFDYFYEGDCMDFIKAVPTKEVKTKPVIDNTSIIEEKEEGNDTYLMSVIEEEGCIEFEDYQGESKCIVSKHREITETNMKNIYCKNSSSFIVVEKSEGGISSCDMIRETNSIIVFEERNSSEN